MNSRERVCAAMRYRPVDRAPVQYYYCPVGYYEHGDKLNKLYASLPGDFSPHINVPVPVIPPEHFDENGDYHAFIRDGWGTLTEYRIFGIAGIPCEYPLADIEKLDEYKFPAPPVCSGEWFEARKKAIADHKKDYYALEGGGSLFERLKALRSDEDVLCDIALNTDEINRLADMITDFDIECVKCAIAAGADGIAFGDDYGSEREMLLAPDMWRKFFLPRLKKILRPAAEADLDVLFHSCGNITPILGDLREAGANAVWPQIPAYNMEWLAKRCREFGLAVAIHTDRANTMTFGSPQEVRDLVKREFETFRVMDGGAWFYIEADNGFPYENLEALVTTIAEYR